MNLLVKLCIMEKEKEKNSKQPGERYRSWARDRQERFICRWVEALSDPRVTHELRSIWISNWTQADKLLGQKLALVSMCGQVCESEGRGDSRRKL